MKLCYGIHSPDVVGKYYKDAALLGKMLKRIEELRMNYYVDCYGEPMVQWLGKWEPYEYVQKLDKKLEVSL